MKEMDIQPKAVIKIIETIIDKYPFIEASHKNDIYKMICTPEEVEKIKAELENDEEMKKFKLDINIVKQFNKNRKYIDEDDYDDF